MSIRFVFSLIVLTNLVLAVPTIRAEALLKPVPIPDLSRLPKERAQELQSERKQFDELKAKAVGDQLVDAYARIGSAYARNGFYDSAAVALEDASVLAPKDSRWIYAQGVLARAQKQEGIAEKYFDTAFVLDQAYLPIRVAVVSARINAGKLEEARTLLADYVAKHADESYPYLMLGDIALRQKHYAEAISQYQNALRLAPKANRLYQSLSDAYAGIGNTKAAADARAKAGDVTVPLNDPLSEGLLGTSSQTSAGRSVQPDANQLAIESAAFLLAAGKYAGARASLDEALKQQPKDSALLALYSRVDAKAGDYVAAKAHAAAAIAADGKNALGYLSQGVALEMSGDDDGAQRSYQRAIELNAGLQEPRFFLATLLYRKGRYDEAIAKYRELVRLNLNDAAAWDWLVAVDVSTNRCGDALRDITDVLAKNADQPHLLELFVRLASTCPAATAEQRQGALEYGRKLRAQNGSASVGEAYALALGANGKWQEAIDAQRAAMFILVRNGHKDSLPGYREVLQQLQAHKMLDRPWIASAYLFHPARPQPGPK